MGNYDNKFNKYEIALESLKKMLDELLVWFCNERKCGYFIGSRIKSEESIKNKINRKNIDDSFDSVSESINDIAGLRVVLGDLECRKIDSKKIDKYIENLNKDEFVREFHEICVSDSNNWSDEIVYDFVDFFKNELNEFVFKIIEEKDYIKEPKESGYQSLHIVVENSDGVRVEIQFRTLAQHYWAQSEHKNVYAKKKKGYSVNLDNSFYRNLVPVDKCKIKKL